MENGVQKIRGSIVPIIRITSQSSSGELELKGTLKLSNMIPVLLYVFAGNMSIKMKNSAEIIVTIQPCQKNHQKTAEIF